MIRYLLISISLLAGSTLMAATNKHIDLSASGQDATTEFKALVKPGSLQINGVGGKTTGVIDIKENLVSGELTVHLNDLSTGISMRDNHMKDKFLETKKYPDAVLKITEMKLPQDPFAVKFKQSGIPFKGALSVHGVESPIAGTADIDSTGTMVLVETKLKTTIAAHKIEKPGYLGVKVADDVDVLTHLKLAK